MEMQVIYNPLLIVFSVLVAILASYVALNLSYNVTQAKGKMRIAWLTGGALVMGIGIWSMHFVGMLAFEMPGMEMAYDIPLMLLSVVVAILGSALALFVVSQPISVGRKSLVISGAAMAAAISGMHYIGMYSMRMSARIEWDLILVAASILIALVTSYAALNILLSLRNKPDRVLLLFFASILMGFAISGMHYTGMFAATFIHDDSLQITSAHLLVSDGLSVTTISTTLFILLLGLLGSLGDRFFKVWKKRSEDILDRSEEKFRVLVEAVKDYAIFMLSPLGYITTWNAGAGKITGYSREEIIGKHISSFYTQEDIDAFTATHELKTAVEKGHFEGEAIRKKKDGTTFWAHIVLDPLYDKDGKLTGFSKVVRDITELKRATARSQIINEELERRVRERTVALQEREQQLRMITNAIPVLVAQLNKHEKFLFANNSFCDWFETTQDQIRSLSFRDVLNEERYPANKIYIDKVLAGETVSYERESKSGKRKAILNITFVPEFDYEKKVIGFIVVASDVSNYKKIETALKNAKNEAEVANETKSAFLANMSHEIRTPLGTILGFSELILDGDLPDAEKQNMIEIIKRNGKLLSTIINDILDLSKVEAGKLQFEKVDVKLNELINEITAFLNMEASNKGLGLTISSEGVIPSTITTDPTRLRQILFNIVGNAIKFTEKGHISLKVKLDEEDPSKIAFVVQDTGAGIAADQTPRLFSPFTQADVTTTRKFGGTGLGLALSKRFAKALGGDVVLTESTLNKGSTFVITIAHGQALDTFMQSTETDSKTDHKISVESARTFHSDLSHLKILLVDDSLDNLALIQRILKLAHADVETANNGKEALEKALNGDFNLVLMDLQMPEMDGYEATKVLRKKGFKNPIVALTAHAMKEERNRCLESGFNEHITKPIDRNHLIHVLSGFN